MENAETKPGGLDGSPTDARRFGTLLRFDVVRSSQFTDANPETPESLLAFIQEAGDICVAHGADIESFQGDALLLTFGVVGPVENSARQAVDAGLGICELIRRRGDFEARVAVHHGLVHVVDVTGTDWTIGTVVTGLAPTVVTRVESVAPVGTLVVTEAVADIVREWYDLRFLGAQALRGLSEPIGLFAVEGRVPRLDRAEPGRSQVRTLIGRSAEIAQLEKAAVERQPMLVVGEPGIGKSRLLHEVFPAGRAVWIRCRPELRASPVAPLVKAVEREAGSADQERVRHFLQERIGVPTPVADLVASTVTPDADTGAVPDRTEAVVSAFATALAAIANERDGVLIADDCQWADPVTRAWLLESARRDGPAIAAAIRTDASAELVPDWPGPTVTVPPLTDAHSRQLLAALVRDELDESPLQALAERAEGVPFFLEELARARNKGWSLETLPPSLRELLDSRIDHRPGTERTILELLAVAGGRCPNPLLIEMAAARREDEGEAAAAIASLTYSGLLDATPAEISFSHDLLRQAAYDRVRLRDRPGRHRLVADVLEQGRFAHGLAPELVAEQWTAAEQPLRAAPHWLEAGTVAAKRGAQHQALDLFNAAAGNLGPTPPDDPMLQPGWTEGRISTQLWRASTMTLTADRGYADDEVRTAYEEARFLTKAVTEVVGLVPETFPASYGLWAYYVVRGEHAIASRLADDLVTISDTSQTPDHRLIATSTAGYQRMYEGDLDGAQRFLHQAVALQVDSFSLPLPQDPHVVSLVGLAAVEQLRGEQDRADELVEATLRAMETVSPQRRSFTDAYTACFIAWIRQMQGDHGRARDHAAAAELAAAEGPFTTWATAARLHRAIAEGWLGNPAALDDLQVALDDWDQLGHRLMRPYFAGHLARLYAEAGRADDARQLATEARLQVADTDERIWVPDLDRLDGAGAQPSWDTSQPGS